MKEVIYILLFVLVIFLDKKFNLNLVKKFFLVLVLIFVCVIRLVIQIITFCLELTRRFIDKFFPPKK